MLANHFCSTCKTGNHLKARDISTELEIKGKKFTYTYMYSFVQNVENMFLRQNKTMKF